MVSFDFALFALSSGKLSPFDLFSGDTADTVARIVFFKDIFCEVILKIHTRAALQMSDDSRMLTILVEVDNS